MVSHIKKRDGTVVLFEKTKIVAAIEKSMRACGLTNETLPETLAQKVILRITSETPSVEEIQDMVESILIDEGHAALAKSYILYRQKRAQQRQIKTNILGRQDTSKLSVNGLIIAKSRYLQKTEEIETPKEMFHRVAKAVAKAEKKYGKTDDEIQAIHDSFFDMMNQLSFIPSGRILANADTKQAMLYSSFVIPIDDSMKGIFRALYHKALIQRESGGTGFSFSKIRAKGSSTSTAHASGPVAFIKLFDYATDLTIHAGNRKAANMGSLSIDHPDIIEFITMKERREIRNFNISVEITDEFMSAVKNRTTYHLKDPVTKKPIDEVDAQTVFNLLVTMAWKTGDPGVLFIDKINQQNPLPEFSRIETTDPCGDQLLFPYEGGNLGALNLSNFVSNEKISWKQLELITTLAVRFLDNVIDVSTFPIKKIEQTVKDTRRIGLGVMGFSDMLYKLRIPYDSEKALQTADKVMKFISKTTITASQAIAKEKDAFPLFNESVYKHGPKMRNASLLAIAPCGSRSLLADTSAGIEPNFALGYIRKISEGNELMQLNKVVEDVLHQYDLHNEETIRSIIKTGSLKDIELSDELKRVFVTAYDISPAWHIKMQAVFQKHIDNAISKTINFAHNATLDDVKNAFLLAYEEGCRGLTVYREGSLQQEVMTFAR